MSVLHHSDTLHAHGTVVRHHTDTKVLSGNGRNRKLPDAL